MKRRSLFQALLIVFTLIVSAVSHAGSHKKPDPLRLVTTTSVANSGLIEYLIPTIQEDIGTTIEFTAIGTGQALRLGKIGKADVLLVQAPMAERKFIREGWGVGRYPVMQNHFIIVGPKSDPAGLKGSKNLSSLFFKVTKGKTPFISRGDQSGTHKKEQALWNKHALLPIGAKWYHEAGLSMGKTLQRANELQGYTLVDQGVWLKNKNKVNLTEVYSNDKELLNIYSIILINSARHQVNIRASSAFLDWFLSDKGKELIASYKVQNQTLFNPIQK